MAIVKLTTRQRAKLRQLAHTAHELEGANRSLNQGRQTQLDFKHALQERRRRAEMNLDMVRRTFAPEHPEFAKAEQSLADLDVQITEAQQTLADFAERAKARIVYLAPIRQIVDAVAARTGQSPAELGIAFAHR